MIAEIISIGTEITIGSILNTNTKYLSEKLLELGIETYYHSSVDDDENRLKDIVRIALDRSDLIITTGGLGPTQDDLTKEVISSLLELELEMDEDMVNHISEMFKARNINMTNNNIKQALKPVGSEFITNELGSAPGIYIKKNEKQIVMLPGPPHEMKLMFENHVIPLFTENYIIATKSINTMGIGESRLEKELIDLQLDTENTKVTTFAKESGVEIKIISKGEDSNTIENEIESIINKLNIEFNEFIYGYDNISLEEIVVGLLTNKQWRIGLAESCTGGLIASKITRIPGASLVLDRSIVSYSNESKIEELNVSRDTLEKYGAVSKETAYEMAKGLFEKANLDLALSITGIAGPVSDNTNKPVGLVYICIITEEGYEILEHNINGNRSSIQNKAANRALFEIRKHLV